MILLEQLSRACQCVLGIRDKDEQRVNLAANLELLFLYLRVSLEALIDVPISVV